VACNPLDDILGRTLADRRLVVAVERYVGCFLG